MTATHNQTGGHRSAAAPRILIVSGIFPPDIGGPATYVPQIASFLVQRGYRVVVVALSDSGAHAADAAYPFRLVRIKRRSFKPLRWARTIGTLLREGRRADTIFVNGLAMEAALVNSVLRRPLVHKVVGDLAWERAQVRGWTRDSFEHFQRRRYGWRIEALRALRAWWTRRATTVIVPSRFLAAQVVGWGVKAARVVTIYNGVNVLGPAPAPIACTPQGKPLTITTVARLVPWKGIDGLLRALARLPELRLVLVGDGPQRAALEQLASALGLAGRVRFAGTRDARATAALLAASDIFVLNSTYEGLPHVVVEAMQLGVPVVATAVGGTPELIRDGVNGRLIPAGDDDALVAALAALAADPALRQRLAQAARAASLAHSHAAMLEQTTRVLEACMAQRAAPSSAWR